MINDLSDLDIEEIKNGYRFDEENKKYICNHCGKEFYTGEIYPFENRFFDCRLAVEIHVTKEHGTVYDLLVSTENKYLGLTENQKNLLGMINEGLSDNEIAKQLGISPSTVRHQKFMFREKAKQAKMYLAVYELAIKGNPIHENLVNIHSNATMVDDRYITTVEERDKILKTAFSSLVPLKLIEFPAKEKKKIVVLKKIVEQLEYGRNYEEKELNRILKGIYQDFPTIRRYLIEYGFMDRTMDCKKYWLK
ncbi:DUF2087 domain-containing protein [Anaerocolumna sp. MB42-C2]|uniref:DUF2087 domain-containing protein n=1 Tax=Anaerocolumna sp. MB42-C2 TaxID=3070997 RepID=UPI0027DEC688|nr:DUF2087 domain-containing protein [Anaerocolumna sp. MB42-C2]WMJ87525.1 DUF2087 domain-containing protein [Anaerocolumna sp. MB42-C2]